MDLSAREDYLEAVLIGTLALKRSPTAGEVAAQLKDLPGTPEKDLAFLEENGDIVLNPDGTVVLTEKGKIVGERVLKKHRVLQCFFHEMLGMDVQAASNEACILEHGVSDSTIQRLGDYIEGSGGNKPDKGQGSSHGLRIIQMIRQLGENGNGGRSISGVSDNQQSVRSLSSSGASGTQNNERSDRTRADRKPRILSDMKEKDRLMVAGIVPGGNLHRLADLGILPGEEISLRRKLRNHTVVVQVKGCDIALSPEIAATILVEDLS